jgi:DNA gyrase subunit A
MDLLANPEKIRALVRDDILMLKEKFGDKRRTSIAAGESGDLSDEDLIGQENVLVAFSANHYIKRVPIAEFREQGRGGTGIIGASLRKDDGVRQLVFARTLDTMILFTDRGRAFSTPVHELPEGSRTSKGQHIANVLNLQPNENVTTMVVVPDFNAASYITLITRQGKIKRMDLALFANVRANGRIAMGLEPGDSLDWARLTNGNQEFMVVSRMGKASRFHETLVRPMGVGAFGVLAMKIAEGDSIVSLDVVKPDADLLVITEQGWGKRVNLDEYVAKGRNIQGNWTTDHTRLDETGPIVAASVVNLEDQISVISANGIALRTNVAGISQYGRITRGVRIMKLKPGDKVATLAVLNFEDLARGIDESGGDLPNPDEDAPEMDGIDGVVDDVLDETMEEMDDEALVEE